jgi:1-acyl-sn-glycerol-3-phosphate acyltransferase
MRVHPPAWLQIPLALLLITANTLAHTLPLFAVALLKVLLPLPAWRRGCSAVLARIAESWIAVNSALIGLMTSTRFHIEGLDGLRYGGSYLVLSNHQSWVDIPVLQKVFNRRIPFMRFFLKRQLIWVPLLGLAWWALDFPFMQRLDRETLKKHPELRGSDVAATRRACARYRGLPVTVMNFVEGTRFTPRKHAGRASPFAHLLRPKAGGVAFVLDAMGDALQAILDVTVVYPGGRPTMMDLLAGRIRDVRVQVRERPIPADLAGGDYESDPAFRVRFQQWINVLWTEKDALIARMLADAAS